MRTKMDAYIQGVATEIFSQLKATVGLDVIWSWGLDSVKYGLCNGGMPTLVMHVNGRLFKGYVLVALDEGSDTYKIFTRKTIKGASTCICEEAYCDNFGGIIDRYVESGDDTAEYQKFCEQQLFNI